MRPLGSGALAREVEIPPQGLSLGRDDANDLVLDPEPQAGISRFHARLRFRDGVLWIEEIASRTGVHVNGQRVTRSPLQAGDTVQLGDGECRFVVIPAAGTAQPVAPEAAAVRAPVPPPAAVSGRSRSARPARRARGARGVPGQGARGPALAATGRRGTAATVGLLLMLAGGLGSGFLFLWKQHEKGFEELRFVNRALAVQLRHATQRFADQKVAWEEEKSQLEAERLMLLRKLRTLEASGMASVEELQRLRRELDNTSKRLEQYRTVQVKSEDEDRHRRFAQVLAAVVFIEKKVVFREKGGTRYLEEFTSEGPTVGGGGGEEGPFHHGVETGSGFCVSRDGRVITNAHVISAPKVEGPVEVDGVEFVLEARVNVVFSGTSRKLPAKVIRTVDDGENDFAIIQVEPFEGMACVEDFRLDIELPPPGSPVQLFGFPLGRNLLQEKDVLTASVFSGIVSRKVSPYLQVQAAVYPGNSGGPAVDKDGRIIGIVTGVQRVPGGQIASDIGFVLPITGLKAIWAQ